jgi:hypothetical protein
MRILLYAAGAVKSNSEVTCLGLFPALPVVVVVSCNCCSGGGDDGDDGVNVCSSLPISSENKMGDIQLTYRYHGIQLIMTSCLNKI